MDHRLRPAIAPPSKLPFVPRQSRRVILDGELASGGTAPARVTAWDGAAWDETGETITVREIFGLAAPLAATTVCKVDDLGAAGWCVTAAACPAES